MTVGTGSTTTTIDGSFEYPTIRPTLDLNFAATKTLDSRISFSRDSIGTYVGEDGLIKYASNNVPRFDHDITTRESLGLLIEEGRTNVIPYSVDFSNAAWTKINGGTGSAPTVTSNYAISPDGTTTASRIQAELGNGTSSSDFCLVRDTITTDGTDHTWSVWLKSNTTSNQNVIISWYHPDFVSPPDVVTVTPTWKRFTLTKQQPGFEADIGMRGDATNITRSVDILAWGGQLEDGSFATSYIPTSGSTVNRTTDIAKITGTNFTSFYTAEEFTLYGDGRSITGSNDVGGNPALVSIDDNTGNNRFILRRWDPGGATPRSGFTFRYRRADINLNLDAFPYGTAGGYDATGDLPDWQDASLHKIVFGVNNNSQVPQDIAGYGDGFDANFAVTNPGGYTGTEILTPYTAATQMQIGFGAASARWNGHVSSIKYYPKRLPDAQLKGLTHH